MICIYYLQIIYKILFKKYSMKKQIYFFTSILSLSLFGCSGVNFDQWHFPYYVQIDQGTYLTNDNVNQIHIGMTKNDINMILDKPINQFLFDSNRWDFIYQNYVNNKLIKSYNLTLFFKKDIVYKIEKTNNFYYK